ncbi:MAG TPA: hypothetical protein VEA78_10265 [Acidimicrobiales bacterium]|nr:hypothetical protein [Acidimicrobiales bacterium]
MTEKLSKEELEAQDGAELADKEAMSVLDTVGGLADGGLLNLDVDLSLDADVAAPIDAAVAANANVAAPIDAAVAANVASVGSTAQAVSDQDAMITQTLDGVAEATANQDATIEQ